MNDEVHVVGLHVVIRGVVAELPVLAGREREAKPIGEGSGVRRGSGTADRRYLTSRAEAIPVGSPRLEARDLDVHGMREVGRREGDTLLNDVLHPIVGRDLPVDRDGIGSHAAPPVGLRS